MPAPVPPFTRETAIVKVRMAEDAWNSRDPHRVSLAYTEDSRWRNRAEFLTGRAEIVAFLTRKWQKELDYRLIKEMWPLLAASAPFPVFEGAALDGNAIDGARRSKNLRMRPPLLFRIINHFAEPPDASGSKAWPSRDSL
jgi:hypothetical protein